MENYCLTNLEHIHTFEFQLSPIKINKKTEGAFINYFMVIGNVKTFGILYNELLEAHDLDSGSTAFIGSIQRFITSLVGPLAGFISVTYSFRGAALAGGVLSAVGMVGSSLSTNPDWLFLTYTTLIGIGFGMAFPAAVSIVNYYFDKRRAMANGIVCSSGGLGTLVFPALYRILFDTYGLQGGLLILGGVCFNMCVGAIMYRQPLSLKKRQQENLHNPDENSNCCVDCGSKMSNHLKNLFQTFRTIATNRLYILYTAAFSCSLVGFTTTFAILPPHLRSHGVAHSDMIIMFMTIGVTELIARVGFGLLIDMQYITAEVLFMINYGINGICTILFPFFATIPIFYSYCIIVGLFPGSMMALMPVILVPVCGLQFIPPAVALVLLCCNSVALVAVPFFGWLEDLTGNWTASFLVLGCIQILATIFVFIAYKFVPTNTETKTNSQPTLDGNISTRHQCKNKDQEVND